MHWKLLLGLLVVFTVSCAVEGKKRRKRSAQCLPMTGKAKKVTLRCKSDELIYAINITSFVWPDNKCQDTTHCSGLQPNILTSSNLCYWKDKCVIRYSNITPIIRTSNTECIGRNPANLYLKYLCASNESIYFLQKDSDNDNGSEEKTSDKGMIVSHIDFPWHYTGGLFFRLILRPDTSENTHLNLWVQFLEIDTQRDKARVFYENTKQLNLTMQPQSIKIPGPKVKLEFLTDGGTSGGQGFVICYRWDRAAASPTPEEICGKRRRRKHRKKTNDKVGSDRKKKGKRNKGKRKKNRKNRKRKGKSKK